MLKTEVRRTEEVRSSRVGCQSVLFQKVELYLVISSRFWPSSYWNGDKEL